LKSKFLLSLVAVLSAALMPLAAAAQVAPERHPAAEHAAPTYKYQAFLGVGYTSLNQVNQSRYGLNGITGAVSRDFTRHVGVTVNADYYRWAFMSGNPGSPSVLSISAGPEFKATLIGNFDGFVNILVGAEHTGGESMTPSVSFSGGFGGGLVYNLGQRWAIRASGERMSDSFSLTGNSTQLGYSPHTHYNQRGAVGVVYRF